ncbi:starvation-sensing protein RspA, partial [Candidatus Latescibacterota bacterium]
MNRRDIMKSFVLATTAGSAGIFSKKDDAIAQTYSQATKGLPPLTITKVKCIRVGNLNVVKVETSEPGLYGLGCATFQQRPITVAVAVDDYLDPFCKGKNVDNIEDMWQTAYVSSYWRNGPVLNNAMSGLDQALWDIKGKRANMPVYQLLGGKCRFAVDCYTHPGGRDLKELEESVKRYREEGFRYFRCSVGYESRDPHFKDAGYGMPSDGYFDVGRYVKSIPKMFEHLRITCGDDVELMHDVHERIPPIDAINMVKEVEQYRP